VLLLAVSAPRMMAVTAVWNAVLFLSFSPIPSQRLIVKVWNCYTVEFTHYAIEHRWDPNLSQIESSIGIGQLNTWGWTGGCRNPVSGSRL
jgi:hypothetical protein